MVPIAEAVQSVDTPADLDVAANLLATDDLVSRYA